MKEPSYRIYKETPYGNIVEREIVVGLEPAQKIFQSTINETLTQLYVNPGKSNEMYHLVNNRSATHYTMKATIRHWYRKQADDVEDIWAIGYTTINLEQMPTQTMKPILGVD